MPDQNSDTTAGILTVTAKSLQSFVLGSDKLREMVGATQLIEDFCSPTLAQKILTTLSLENYEIITCAAGQTTIRFDDFHEAQKAATLWPWVAHQLAPGLEIHVATQPMLPEKGGYIQAIDAIQQDLANSRNAIQHQSLPTAAPPAMLAPRSGKLAVAYDKFANKTESVDAEAFTKRKRREKIKRAQSNPVFDAFSFDPDAIGPDLESLMNTPIRLKNFKTSDDEPQRFEARQPSLAMIHADGNGLGQTFIHLAQGLKNESNTDAISCLRDFSEAFTEVGLTASREAIATLHESFLAPLPIQPIVLAGDDLTVITRAELAVPFVEAWLLAFETATKSALKELKDKFPAIKKYITVDSLTAGAGILFFQKSHPFIDAYSRVEHLASFSKNEAKRQASGDTAPSSIAFLKLSGGGPSISPLSTTLTHKLSAMPYYLGEFSQDLHKLNDLRALKSALAAFPSGTVRRFLSEMRNHPDTAESWIKRAIRILEEKPEGIDKIDAFESALRTLHIPGEDSSTPPPAWRSPIDSDSLPSSALPDAIHWASVEPQFPSTTQPLTSSLSS